MRSASRFSWSLTAQLRSSCLGVIDLQPVQAVDCRSLSTVYGSTAVLPFQYCSSTTGHHTTLPTPEEIACSHPPNSYPNNVLRQCPATFPDLHSGPTTTSTSDGAAEGDTPSRIQHSTSEPVRCSEVERIHPPDLVRS